MHYLIIGLFLFCSLFEYQNDYWSARWSIMLGCIGLLVSVQMWKKIHWSVGLACLSTILSCLWVGVWEYNQYALNTDVTNTLAVRDFYALKSMGATSGFGFVLMLLLFLNVTPTHLKGLRDSMGILCLINAIYVIVQVLILDVGVNKMGGVFHNVGMNGGMIAVCMPFLYQRIKQDRAMKFLILLPILAIGLTTSSTAWFAGGAVIGSYIAVNMRRNRLMICGGIGLSLALVGCQFVPDFLQSADRFPKYEMFLNHFWANTNPLFGSGQGTFQLLGKSIQYYVGGTGEGNLRGTDGGVWLWMHSDYLQVLFEQGILGLTAYLLVLVCAFKRTIQTRSYLVMSAIAGWSAMACFYYPAHFPIHALVGMGLIAMTYQKECVA